MGVKSPTPLSNTVKLLQFDGNVSISSDESESLNASEPTVSDTFENSQFGPISLNVDKITAALSLPKIATFNLRSLFPKINSLKTDIVERAIDVSFLQEIWEQSESEAFQFEIEKMLEVEGLQYISTPRTLSANTLKVG